MTVDGTRDVKSTVYISTGKKGVMYTMWRQIIVPPVTIKGADGKDFTSPGWVHHNYIKNLSMTETVAVEKAKEYAKDMRSEFHGIWDSPCNDRANWMDRWGIHFQSKKKNGKMFFMGRANDDFWASWKENKEQIKKEGFWISKFEYTDERRIKQVAWFVFYKPRREN